MKKGVEREDRSVPAVSNKLLLLWLLQHPTAYYLACILISFPPEIQHTSPPKAFKLDMPFQLYNIQLGPEQRICIRLFKIQIVLKIFKVSEKWQEVF